MRSPAVVIACLGLTVLVACEKRPPAPAEIRPVRTVTAVAQAQGEPVSVTGQIRARTEENLAFRVDGRMIVRRVDVGSEVHTNDLVAQLDPQPLRDALRTAQAKLAEAQAALHEAANNEERQRTLLKDGWTTRVQFDAAERAFQTAKAEVDAAAAQVHDAEDKLGYTNLLADAPGFVIATGAEAGEVVRAGQMIVTVAQQGGVDAVFDVPATLIRQVSPDALITVTLSDDPSVRTTGRVRELAPQADPVTRTFRIKVALTQRPEAMRLGATVIGRSNMRETQGIELPATALTTTNNQPALWVVDPKSMEVSLRPVELLRQGSSSIVVSRGIEGGDLVVTAGVHALRPGQKVRLLGSSS
jgi:RND family efflux transporter MFP subunit